MTKAIGRMRNSSVSKINHSAKGSKNQLPMTAYSDHLYQLRSLLRLNKLKAMEIRRKPIAKPSDRTVFQNVICSNRCLSSIGIVSP